MLLGRDEKGNFFELNHNHFTTHSLCVGMTGSGKTGFSVSILEKLALLKIPALILDPKGDLGNIFLIFPELKEEDFAPYTNEPKKFMEIWKKNLEYDNVGKEELLKLKESVERRILTPGISSCAPLNILPSFKAPPQIEIEKDIEDVRERIRNIVSAIFKLLGKEVDPFSDTSFIFLSLCCEHLFKSGKDISLEELIIYLEAPPFSSIGVMPLEKVFPLQDRRNLAFKLNNLIASPQFSSWFSGFPLDFDQIFYSRDGKPCHTVIYLNHLDELLKQFAVTLILSELFNYIKNQKGTEDLRYILYFDEISGFIPPSPSNPPSKAPLLNLLKKARAFGLGLFLSTQNPIDLDYRALSNIGIYLIGRLHTEQDKERIKEVIGRDEVAMQKISNLKPREFWVKDVKDQRTPLILKSLQTYCFLKGPMTVEEIKSFIKPHEFEEKKEVRKIFYFPSNIPIFFQRGSKEFFPYFFSELNLYYSKETAQINLNKKMFLVSELKEGQYEWKVLKEKPDLVPQTPEGFSFKFEFDVEKEVKNAEKNLKEKMQTLFPLTIYFNPYYKIYSFPDEKKEDFLERIKEKAKEIILEKFDEKKKIFEREIKKLREKIEWERENLKKEEKEYEIRSTERNLKLIETAFSLFFGKRKSAISKLGGIGRKHSQAKKEKMDVQMRAMKIKQLEEEAINLKREMDEELLKIEREEREKIFSLEEIFIYPLQSKSFIENSGVVFLDKNSLNL